ncbi:MAG: methyltransferase domain-containing protein [Acidobacteria bacterium]|nr:methyltransferase domain-containing protein [Acidobacteriota bacterium]
MSPPGTVDVAMTCRACGGGDLEVFYEVASIPSQTCVLLDTAEEAAAYPTGSIVLGFCRDCGFIQNTVFDPQDIDYSQPTEESQAFSPEFQRFAAALASDLVERHRLRGRTALEVGCGKGDFLQLLAERGIAEGVGIDPGYLPNREVDGATLRFTRKWYGGDDVGLTGDLVLTRHLLEHIPNVAEFAGWLLASTRVSPGAGLFTEVPDVRRVLREGAFWDVYYEHCSYFTLGSLGRMLRDTGLRLDRLEMGFGDQYLLADGVPGEMTDPHPAEEPVEEVAVEVAGFATETAQRVADWRDRIEQQDGHVAVWGGGSKAVAFLAAVGADAGAVTVVDINPHKKGKFLPGTAIEVEPPQALVDRRPELVIPMNPIYETEIRRDLAAMGLDPAVIPL